MPKQARKRIGRPPSDDRGVVYRVVITLHPRKDAAIIARIESAGKGRLASTIVDLMRNGVGRIADAIVPPEKEESAKIVRPPVDVDF
jgi:hypothetical protein